MDQGLVDFAFELGLLKRLKRTGWWVAGINDPESVADHSLRACALAYVIALLEGGNPERAASLSLFHDLPECRITDHHRIALRYVDQKKAESDALEDQLSSLPPELKENLYTLFKEYQEGKTKEAIAARDADHLECLLQAREYQSQGFPTESFVQSSRKALVTSSAKKLAEAISLSDPSSWWKKA